MPEELLRQETDMKSVIHGPSWRTASPLYKTIEQQASVMTLDILLGSMTLFNSYVKGRDVTETGLFECGELGNHSSFYGSGCSQLGTSNVPTAAWLYLHLAPAVYLELLTQDKT